MKQPQPATVLRAEGFAVALDKIFAVAQTVDSKTMSLLRPFLEHGIKSSDSADRGEREQQKEAPEAPPAHH